MVLNITFTDRFSCCYPLDLLFKYNVNRLSRVDTHDVNRLLYSRDVT